MLLKISNRTFRKRVSRFHSPSRYARWFRGYKKSASLSKNNWQNWEDDKYGIPRSPQWHKNHPW